MTELGVPALVRELRIQTAILRIMSADALEQERTRLREDPDCVAILRGSATPVAATALKSAVQKTTGHSSATVERRLADLVARGYLERGGGGSHITYHATGVIEL